MKSLKIIVLSISFALAVCMSACYDINPQNEILKIYRSPKLNSYKIEKIALLPMVKDDTTETGTFYSTNHFLNILEKRFPKKTFFVPAMDDPIAEDSLVPNLIQSIEKLKRLDLKILRKTRLYYSLEEEKPDAILIGNFSKLINNIGYRGRFKATLTSCEISYYLISMKDGRVLWKADALGEEGYYLLRGIEIYPPLDFAISNAIDKIVAEIPFN